MDECVDFKLPKCRPFSFEGVRMSSVQSLCPDCSTTLNNLVCPVNPRLPSTQNVANVRLMIGILAPVPDIRQPLSVTS